MQEILSLT